MKCEVCKRGPANGVSVFRQNKKGEPGRWRCKEHTDVEIDSALENIVSDLESKEGQQWIQKMYGI